MKHTALALAALGLLLQANPARACPVLEKAVPRVGATVEAPPRDISLTFSGPVELDRSLLEVRDAKGTLVTQGSLHQSKDTATVGVNLKPGLAPGRYKVRWSIHCHCQEDNETAIPGSYSFTVQ